jgi:hypothetical protein
MKRPNARIGGCRGRNRHQDPNRNSLWEAGSDCDRDTDSDIEFRMELQWIPKTESS